MLSDFFASVARLRRHSAVRFLVVGGLSAIVDTGSLIVFHGYLGVWLPLATALANLVAFSVNFGLNKIWSFGASGAMARQLRRYTYLSVVNLGLMTVVVPFLAWTGINYVVAKVITTMVLAVMNYFISRRWIFVAAPERAPRTPVWSGSASGPAAGGEQDEARTEHDPQRA